MKFKLRIPGRDDFDAPPAAKVANQRIEEASSVLVCGIAANDAPASAPADEPIRRFAGFAAHEISDAETARHEKRQARIAWLGYGAEAELLAGLLLRRDRDMDDRRLCVECSHAGPGWRCAKGDAFFIRQLQRCDNFQESIK